MSPAADNTGSAAILAAAVRRLGSRFVERSASEIHALYEQLERARLDQDALIDAARIAHSICGAGASLGFGKVSTLARAIERQIRQHVSDAFPPGNEFHNELRGLVARLEEYILRAASELGCASVQRGRAKASTPEVSEGLQPGAARLDAPLVADQRQPRSAASRGA